MTKPAIDNRGLPGNVKLPMSSRGEDLETISRNKLSLHFDTRYFEVRAEHYRDKGIDFIIELKQNSAYTNFRFAVQLKSTRSARVNKDSSISYPIEVSNINYLLNYPMPAYYILYDHKHDHFYYEEALQVFRALDNKHYNQNYPNSFKFRFQKYLTQDVIEGIYKKNLNNGNLLRSLTPHIDFSLSNPAGANGIVIDQDNVVSTIEENIRFIEMHGFALLNNADFNTIIKVEQRAYPRKEVSPIFNLICGAAYFYKGKSYKALDFLRLSQKKESQLEPLLQSMLSYIFLHAKHHAGILDSEELNVGTQSILDGEDLGSFLEIQKAWKSMQESPHNGTKRLKDLSDSLLLIIEKEPDNPKARGMAYVVLLDAESNFLINDLNKNLFFAVGSGKTHLTAKIYETWNLLERTYHKRLDRLMQFLMQAEDFQSSSNLVRIKVSWHYQKAYITHFFDNWNFATLQSEGILSDSIRKQLSRDCSFINDVSELFKNFEKEETMIQFLILKYQLLVFLEEHQSAALQKDAIYNLIEEHDLEILRKQFDLLTAGAFPHIHYQNDVGGRLKHLQRIAQNEGIEKYLINPNGVDLDETSNAKIKWTIDEFIALDIPSTASIPF